MKIQNKVKLILTKPTEFFKKTLSDNGYKNALKYFLTLLLVYSILKYLSIKLFGDIEIEYFYNFIGGEVPVYDINEILSFSNQLTNYILFVILSYVLAVILHLWIKLFKGKSSLSKTYQLFVYGSTPLLLFGWIPFIENISTIYSMIILIHGSVVVHKISIKKSILLFLIPYLIFLLLSIIVLMSYIELFSIV